MSVLSCLHFHYLCGNKFWQDMNLTKYERRPSREVRIGRVVIGGDRPIAVQSMTNTDTKDTEACIRQIERIFRAGGPIVRLTAQGRREGENLERIVRRLREEGCDAAVVADIHFVPEVAAIAAKYVDKVRINPEIITHRTGSSKPSSTMPGARRGDPHRRESRFALEARFRRVGRYPEGMVPRRWSSCASAAKRRSIRSWCR